MFSVSRSFKSLISFYSITTGYNGRGRLLKEPLLLTLTRFSVAIIMINGRSRFIWENKFNTYDCTLTFLDHYSFASSCHNKRYTYRFLALLITSIKWITFSGILQLLYNLFFPFWKSTGTSHYWCLHQILNLQEYDDGDGDDDKLVMMAKKMLAM